MTSTDLEPTALESIAEGFSALGDPLRLRIVGELTDGQRCVCELLEATGVAANLLSYHLRVLKEAGLVESSRRGRWVDYRLADDTLAALVGAIPGRGPR